MLRGWLKPTGGFVNVGGDFTHLDTLVRRGQKYTNLPEAYADGWVHIVEDRHNFVPETSLGKKTMYVACRPDKVDMAVRFLRRNAGDAVQAVIETYAGASRAGQRVIQLSFEASMIRDPSRVAASERARAQAVVQAAQLLKQPTRVCAFAMLEDVQLMCPNGIRQAEKLAAHLRRHLKRLQFHEVRTAKSALGYLVVVAQQEPAQAQEIRTEAAAWRNSPDNNERPGKVVDGTKEGRAPALYPRLYGREARKEIEARDQAAMKPKKTRGKSFRLRPTDDLLS